MPKPRGVECGAIQYHHLKAASHHGSRGEVYPSGPLPDWAIREFITIEDFVDYDECPKDVVSYGLTSAGYDLRVGYDFAVFTNAHCATVDPKAMSEKSFIRQDLTPVHDHHWGEVSGLGDHLPFQKCVVCGAVKGTPSEAKYQCPVTKADHCLIPPNCFALAASIEKLYIPRNVDCWCIGKSTYARCGINMNFTPFEPGWYGIVTVEIINATPLPVKIYAGEGIGQAQFFLMAGSPERDYGQKKNAKYQGQVGLTLPKVK